jgi:hypothetical protein
MNDRRQLVLRRAESIKRIAQECEIERFAVPKLWAEQALKGLQRWIVDDDLLRRLGARLFRRLALALGRRFDFVLRQFNKLDRFAAFAQRNGAFVHQH